MPSCSTIPRPLRLVMTRCPRLDSTSPAVSRLRTCARARPPSGLPSPPLLAATVSRPAPLADGNAQGACGLCPHRITF